MAGSKPRATYDDLKKLPEHLIGEIIDGELIATPRPVPAHGRAAGQIFGGLHGPFDRDSGGPSGPGGWWFLFEPELHLHGDVLVPDVAGWRRERMPKNATASGIELPPDWVCEILSRSTARHDRLGKMQIYAREKISHVWLVDPVNHVLEVYRLNEERLELTQVFSEAEKARIEPFDAVELELQGWWME